MAFTWTDTTTDELQNVPVTPFVVSGLTEVDVNGTGVLDVLLRTWKLHIHREYEDGRITGKEYSEIYLQGFMAILQQATQFLIASSELTLKIRNQDKNDDLIAAQIALMRQKAATELAQTDPSGTLDGSVIATQTSLLEAQEEAYTRDAEQKVAQLMLQTWITRLNNDGAATNNANMLLDNYIGRSVASLFAGLGISTSGRNESDLTVHP